MPWHPLLRDGGSRIRRTALYGHSPPSRARFHNPETTVRVSARAGDDRCRAVRQTMFVVDSFQRYEN